MAGRPSSESLLQGLKTKSDKIRVLHASGYSRSEIAELLGIRYQHVRNVLVDDERRAGARGASTAATGQTLRGMADETRAFLHGPESAQRVTVGRNGELRIPQIMLEAAGAKEGDALLVRFEDGDILMYTQATATRRVQALVRQFIPEGVNLADELIAERRLEAKRELEDE